MKYQLSISLTLELTFPLFAQDNEPNRPENAGQTMEQIVNAPEKIPQDVLDQADCVVIVPSILRFTAAPADNYGSGVITCRGGIGFNGPWGAPAMIALEGTTAESQLSGNATDFVLLLMSPRAVDKLLKDKVNLGGDASSAAGPVTSTTSRKTDFTVRTDILSYSRARGKFAGISLEGSTLRTDDGANKSLYGQDITAENIVFSWSVSLPDSARNLLTTLQRVSPTKKLKAVPK
jgi:lipid-binding SYLF domain-containing protein